MQQTVNTNADSNLKKKYMEVQMMRPGDKN